MYTPKSTDSRSAALTDTFDRDELLDAARELFQKQGEGLALPPSAEALLAAGLGTQLPPASGSSRAGEFVTAARHDLVFESPVNLGLPLATAPAMRAAAEAGPFPAASGSFTVRLFGPVETLSIHGPGTQQATFVLTRARRPAGSRAPRTIELDGGTIWILASALGADMPAGAYAGFNVGSGTLTFRRPLRASGNRLAYTGPLDATLDTSPAGNAPASPAGPVITAAAPELCPSNATVTAPGSIHIAWSPGGITIALGNGSATFAGNHFVFSGYNPPPRFDGDLNIFFFPYTVSPVELDAATLTTAAAQFAGATGVEAGWAISLVQPDPSGHLGEALSPGMYVFYCQDVIQVTWEGSPAAADLVDARVIVRQDQLLLSTRHGNASVPFTETIRLWAVRSEATAPRIPLRLRLDGGFVFTYYCDASAGHGFYATCGARLALDRPVNIAGAPLVFPESSQALFGVQHGPAGIIFRVAALASSIPQQQELLALRNGLIPVTEPVLFFLQGAWMPGNTIDSGVLILALGAFAWLPTLPDPYVTNHILAEEAAGSVAGGGPLGGGAPALITCTVTWPTPQTPAVFFQGLLGVPAGINQGRTIDPARPVQQPSTQIRVPTQTAQGSIIHSLNELAPNPPSTVGQLPSQAPLIAAFEARANAVLSQDSPLGAIRLLDVSTNQDLLGVEMPTRGSAGQVPYQLAALDVCRPASGLHVFALPQVQWEPVRTLERDQDIPHLGFFPTPLASVADGGATQLAVQAVRLTPVIPDLATNVVLQEFVAGQPVGLVTTLPFGLRAVLELRPHANGARGPDLVARNQPEFPDPDLRGGAQVTFIAESGPSGRDDSSYFDGTAIQVRNGVSLASGAPLDISVLGSVIDPADSIQEMFNNEFGPNGSTARVPVTRLDISGYGGSCFSDWTRRNAAFAEASKAQFQVIVGRTALEIVKFATVLYPWGIRLTRSVTIERRGGGGVIRRDSGWQASSPGLFQFPSSMAPGTQYIVHPGLLRGLFGVNNIRSTGLAPISFNGANGQTVTVAPKFFDARIRIDGLEGATDLAANGILGFLQIAPIGEPLHEDDLRLLIEQQGPPGGPVDGTVQVGGSGFRVRATRIEVGLANGAGGRPEFIGTVRTAPVFRQEGAWSAVRSPGPANPNGEGEAVTVNQVQGLPVVREGQLLGVTGDSMNLGPRSDYRFADAADVHHPDNPVWEYAFLQTSPAHAFLFPRPHIEHGVREIRTRTQPRFADCFSRMTSKGIFPPAGNSVILPPNVLAVDATTGGFRLQNDVNLAAPRPPLILSQKGSDLLQIDYGGATLALAIAQDNWEVDLPGIELWGDCLSLSKAIGIRSHLAAGTDTRPVVRDIHVLLKGDIESALTFLPGFGPNDRPQMGPIDLGTSNLEHEHKFGLNVEHTWKFPPELPEASLDSVPQVLLSAGATWEISFSEDWSAPIESAGERVWEAGAMITGGVEAKIPLLSVGALTLYELIGAEIGIGVAGEINPEESPDSIAKLARFELKAFLGFGVNTEVFDGSLAIGYQLAITAGAIKNGIFAKVDFELELVIVTVEVEGEIGGLWYKDNSHPPKKHASDVEGELQINVELLFISLHFGWQYAATHYHD